jgi:hypothetical protein
MPDPNGPLVSEDGWAKFEESLEAAAKPEEPKAETPAPVAEPEVKPEAPAEPAKPEVVEPEKPEPIEEPAEDVGPEAIVKVFAELPNEMKARVREALGVRDPAAEPPTPEAKAEDDPDIKALLESDDAGVRAVGKTLLAAVNKANAADARAAALEKQINDRDVQSELASIDKEIHHILSNYVVDQEVDGKIVTRNVTQSHVEQVTALLAENPNLARAWTIERALKAQFPNARLRSSELGGGPRPGIKPAQPAQPTAVIVDAGATPSAPVGGPKPEAPAKTISEAVDRGMLKEFGLKPL